MERLTDEFSGYDPAILRHVLFNMCEGNVDAACETLRGLSPSDMRRISAPRGGSLELDHSQPPPGPLAEEGKTLDDFPTDGMPLLVDWGDLPFISRISLDVHPAFFARSYVRHVLESPFSVPPSTEEPLLHRLDTCGQVTFHKDECVLSCALDMAPFYRNPPIYSAASPFFGFVLQALLHASEFRKHVVELFKSQACRSPATHHLLFPPNTADVLDDQSAFPSSKQFCSRRLGQRVTILLGHLFYQASLAENKKRQRLECYVDPLHALLVGGMVFDLESSRKASYWRTMFSRLFQATYGSSTAVIVLCCSPSPPNFNSNHGVIDGIAYWLSGLHSRVSFSVVDHLPEFLMVCVSDEQQLRLQIHDMYLRKNAVALSDMMLDDFYELFAIVNRTSTLSCVWIRDEKFSSGWLRYSFDEDGVGQVTKYELCDFLKFVFSSECDPAILLYRDHLESGKKLVLSDVLKFYALDDIFSRFCAACFSESFPLNVCSRCKIARYCSRDCQRGDWKKHRRICREFNDSEVESGMRVRKRIGAALSRFYSMQQRKRCADWYALMRGNAIAAKRREARSVAFESRNPKDVLNESLEAGNGERSTGSQKKRGKKSRRRRRKTKRSRNSPKQQREEERRKRAAGSQKKRGKKSRRRRRKTKRSRNSPKQQREEEEIQKIRQLEEKRVRERARLKQERLEIEQEDQEIREYVKLKQQQAKHRRRSQEPPASDERRDCEQVEKVEEAIEDVSTDSEDGRIESEVRALEDMGEKATESPVNHGDDDETDSSDPSPLLERVHCVVCMESKKTILFQPCNHLVCCNACAESLEVCPMCRTPIERRVSVFGLW